ncbi:MAG: PLP-dependent aminotransferase family protein, partial [Clostridia bacterium]
TGTFSKSLAPVMRTAYMILPPELKARYASRYGRYNAFVPTLHQLTLAGFIDEGFYEQHINRLRTLYRKKYTALLRAVDEVFGDKVKITGEGAGIHLLIDVKCGLTQEDLIARAAAAGIRLYPTRALYAVEGNAPQHQLLLGFPLVPESAFIGIMAKLHDAWEM